MNWNILLALGKQIKRDSMSSVNESRIMAESKMGYYSVWT